MERRYYYEASSIRENIHEFVNAREAAVSFSTVNEDGSPNVSVMIPQMTKDDKYLFVGLGNSNTKENILRRKQAMILFYKFTKAEEDKFKRNIGLRLLVELDETEGIHEAYGIDVRMLMLKVIEVIPLG